MSPPAARIVVIDDDDVLRQRIVGVLRGAADLSVVGEANTLALATALLPLKPNLVLLDLGLPDGDGGQLIPLLRAADASCKVLVLSVFEDRTSVVNAFCQGADGYLLKDSADEDLTGHVRATLAGESPISARVAGHLLRYARREEQAPPSPEAREASPPVLSPREKELLKHLAKGASRKEAARLMGISPFTAAEYLQNLYRKLSVRSRGQAVYKALQSRLIDLATSTDQ